MASKEWGCQAESIGISSEPKASTLARALRISSVGEVNVERIGRISESVGDILTVQWEEQLRSMVEIAILFGASRGSTDSPLVSGQLRIRAIHRFPASRGIHCDSPYNLFVCVQFYLTRYLEVSDL